MPQVKSIAISSHKGTKKKFIERSLLISDFGFEFDAHSQPGTLRQVSILSEELFEEFKNEFPSLCYGDFGENLVISELETGKVKLADHIRIGSEVVLEVTQIGKECHSGCEIFMSVGRCIMPEFGIFCKVIKGGEVCVEDSCSYDK